MPFAPQPIVELPNLRTPIALVVDDPAPCINPLWYFRHQVDKQNSPAHERTIGLDFLRAWCEFVSESGIRGDFTVLPYPAGLGRIDEGLEGFDPAESRAWIDLAREAVAPQFDIHCEILTHTNALDLNTWKMLPISEHEWSMAQEEDALAGYFAVAMQILADAGLPNYGVTQPCYYHGDESLYARAVLAAEKRVSGRKVTHNFLHLDGVSDLVPPRITHLDEATGEAVVSVWAATDDFIWNTQDRGSAECAMTPQALADRYLTEDSAAGRLAALLAGGGPIVLVTHWQSLYSNGSRLGLATYREIARRIDSLWKGRVAWNKLSELSERFLAARTVRLAAEASANRVIVTAEGPFGADLLTVSIPTPWPLYAGPTVAVDGKPAQQVMAKGDLAVGKWLMRGSVVTVSLPFAANSPRRITVDARPA